MYRRTPNTLAIILSFFLVISLALNVILVLKITGKIDISFNKSEEESKTGIDYDTIRGIYLYINYDEETGTAEQRVEMEKWKNICKVSVYSSGDLYKSGEFSVDVFDDVVNTMRENNLPEYKPKTNEHGQVVKGIVSYKLIVNTDHNQFDLNASTIDAMDLISKIITIGNNIQ